MDKRIILLSIPAAIINLLIFTYLKSCGINIIIMIYLITMCILAWAGIILAYIEKMDGDDK